MSEIMLRCENVSKQYRLGAIGGTTLREDIQRLSARILKKEDPTSTVGEKGRPTSNERFLALDGISFEVKKGEAVGIIGKNGAGKSTLLKLITRITGPTTGTISLNGRVASMLEVGTGFHPELTGRENIYMNGAILGMSKREISKKIEEIIDFSEVRQFIDTPVKRYSSGMYVKLAFSVAAHLDSDIVIMDEVLAVGDMAFQNKCLSKMRQSATEDGKTVLYVSHNMNTIRQLCDRVIVLDKGKMIFDGDVEEGIGIYMNNSLTDTNLVTLHDKTHAKNVIGGLFMEDIEFLDCQNAAVTVGDPLKFRIGFRADKKLDGVRMRITVKSRDDVAVGVSFSDVIGSFDAQERGHATVSFDTSLLAEGTYFLNLALCQLDDNNNPVVIDHIVRACSFTVNNKPDDSSFWSQLWWGSVKFPRMPVCDVERENID